MRVFAVLTLVPTLLLAAPTSAFACGDGEGQVEFTPQRQPNTRNVLLVRASELDDQAADAEDEAAAADRRARSQNREARRLQQRAVQREGIELARFLEQAREVALQAGESKAHATRARRRAAQFRAQARDLRIRAGEVATPWRGRSTRAGFSTL